MNPSWTLVGTLRRGLVPLTLLGWLLAGCADWSDSMMVDDGAAAPPGGAPTEPAPTGQRWEAVEDDKGCGRTGIRYVLVDEVCGGAGLGYADPQLQAPMFRDGALFGSTLLAVDATHLWALDLSDRANVTRTQLLGGLGQPVAATAYGSELLLAAGGSGLLRLDASNPVHPTRTSQVELPGFALDVETQGSKAHVALGRAGLGIVDLNSGELEATIAIPGYATGVTSKGGFAYVASCDALTVVDLTTRSVVGRTWTPYAMDGSLLAAPAKDVTVIDDVAFVAAGRHGAVSIDVSNPSAPQVLGNCTLAEPSFYASGVRAKDGTLFVAGGEYGILPVDVSDPRAACSTLVPPVQNAPTTPESSQTEPDAGTNTCSTEPPWEVLPWETLWAPPPPRKDPIQTLPGDGVVYAFGDARRIGTRAVDVREVSAADLPLVGRYDEPRRALDLAASGARVLVVGAAGGLFTYVAGSGLTPTPSDSLARFRAASAAVFTGNGRWAVLEGRQIHVEGRDAPLSVSEAPEAMTAVGTNGIAVASKSGVDVFDLASDTRQHYAIPQSSTLPLTLAASGDALFAAAPEWTQASQIRLGSGASSLLPTHGVFDGEEALDTTLWRTRLPRRELIAIAKGVVEVAVIGRKAGLVVHGYDGNERTTALPAATFSAIGADDRNVYVTSLDRAHYRSTLFTIATSASAPTLVGTEVFTGGAAGLAATRDHVYVADADGALRVYDTTSGLPTLEAIVTLEVP